MSGQARNDMQVDALVRRLDVEQRPAREFVDETFTLIRAHAQDARRRDASTLGRVLSALPIPARPTWRLPTTWRPVVAVALALLALLIVLSLALTGPGRGLLPGGIHHVLFGRGHPGVDGYDLWVVGADGSDPHLLVAGANDVSRVSPDGTMIATPIDGATVFTRIYRSDGTILRDLHPGASLETLNFGVAAWSHDGLWLAVEAWDDTSPDRNGVYLIRSDGSELRRLTGPGVPGEFSGDDRQILVTRQEGLFLVNADGSGERSVGVVRPVAYASPGFMPDQRSIYAAADGALWIIDIGSGSARSIAVPGGALNVPRRAAGGTMFSFTFDAQAADTTAIWVMHLDGSDPHQVADDPAVNEDFSDWLP